MLILVLRTNGDYYFFLWGKKMLISKYGNGSTELVNEFESRLGIELDEEYRSFLVKYNGGDTPNTHVGIRGCSTDLRSLNFAY